MPTLGTKRTKDYTPWQPIFLVHFYRYAKAGLTNEAICKITNTSRSSMYLWLKKRPELVEALRLAREQLPDEDGFVRFFYEQLDGRLRDLWDQIVTNEIIGGGVQNMRVIMADQGTGARQALFLHALVSSHFNPSRAMEKVGLDKRTLDQWTDSDPDFAELVSQVQWHKGNFFEEGLVKLCERGDAGAIQFANRTYNKSRGYGNSLNVSGSVDINIENRMVLDLSELDLDSETRAKIAEAVRAREQRLADQRVFSQKPLEERLLTQISSTISERADE